MASDEEVEESFTGNFAARLPLASGVRFLLSVYAFIAGGGFLPPTKVAGCRPVARRVPFVLVLPRHVNYFIWAVPPPSFREWGQPLTKWWNGVPLDYVRPQS